LTRTFRAEVIKASLRKAYYFPTTTIYVHNVAFRRIVSYFEDLREGENVQYKIN